METPDLTPSSPDDVQFEVLLRRANPELPDDGFSLRVLAALPPPRPLRAYARTLTCALGLILGSVFAWQQIESLGGFATTADQIKLASDQLARDLTSAAGSPVLSSTLFALAVAAASLLYALHPGQRRATL